jgi:protoporphyrinogen oxidase
MKIAILGGGFTGLSAALYLSKQGHKVFVFEKEKNVGGLASGFKKKGWEWPLDKYYHHLFTNDETAFKMAKEVNQELLTLRPRTSTLINKTFSQLDSPISLIKFPFLSFLNRFRMGLVLGFLRLYPNEKPFEKHKAKEYLLRFMGKKSFKMIWEPLFLSKFGKYTNHVSLAWFWARVKKRTSSLAYPKGGFVAFAEKMMDKGKSSGVEFILNTEVLEIGKGYIKLGKNKTIKKETFDKIISTLPTSAFLKITKNIPDDFKRKLIELKSLATINLLLRLKKPFFPDDTYWLNVCEPNSKLMGVVEHTNFINKKYYNNETLVYIGKYIPKDHRYLKQTKEELLKELTPSLLAINKEFQENLIGIELYKDYSAQPIITKNYKEKIPTFDTGINGLYFANLDQVYPWDRGINYSIELGEKVAKLM